MATRQAVQARPEINTFGFKPGLSQLTYHLAAFAERRTIAQGALRRFDHFKTIADTVYPKTDWNPWFTRAIEELCEDDWAAMVGAANAGKTHSVAFFCAIWWMCLPRQSSVQLTSTTGNAIRRRAWPIIQRLYSTYPGERLGHFLDHKTTWQAVQGDDKHSICAVAVADGNTAKAIDHIKGIHTRRQILVIDEAEATPEAAFGVIDNQISGPEEYKVIVIGNPRNRLVSFGAFCEPKAGWTSVTVDDEGWFTKPQLNGKPARVLRFDAEKSPNIVHGKNYWPYLPTEDRVEHVRKARGGGNHPSYWTEFRGFWPPDGISRTVFTESAIETFNARKPKHEFVGGGMFVVGGLDPAFSFGGDKAIIRFARCGEIEKGIIGIELLPPIVIPLNSSSTNPINYQIAERTRELCDQHRCTAENLAVDATGGGVGTCDVLARLWSNRIIRVMFGGAASNYAVSNEDGRSCDEVYQNKVTEMWFTAKEFTYGGQVRGLDYETAIQLCSREYDDRKKLVNLESKADYKKRTGRPSPDEADAFALCIEAARIRGAVAKAVGETVNASSEWDKRVAEANDVYESVNYQHEEVTDLIEAED